jgi:hypothetical protein
VSGRRSLAARVAAAAISLLLCLVAVSACAGGGATFPPASVAVTAAATDAATTADDTGTPAAIDSPTPALPDPCSLLTQDEANGLAGEALQTQMPEGDPTTNCVWPAPLSGHVAQVEVGVGDGAKKFLDIDKDTLGHDFAQVPGLGDEAWVEDDTIFVRVGDLWFDVHLVGYAGTSEYRPRLEALARTILGRLGR